MLRISEIGGGDASVMLKLEGRIVGAWVGELATTTGQILDAGRTLKINLTDVSFVDREGVKLLLSLAQRKAILDGCSPFVSEELREATKTGEAPSSKPQAPAPKPFGVQKVQD